MSGATTNNFQYILALSLRMLPFSTRESGNIPILSIDK